MEKFGPEGEIYREQNMLLKPVLAKIDAAIQRVGSDQSYDFILDAIGGALLYALDSHDLTQLVIDKMNRMSIDKTD